jgi:hypothetical protein
MKSQVISKKRVTDHGEVLTGMHEVNAMLDLVKQETERIDSRFLEPACGNGNFLTIILERKLTIVEKRYRKSQFEFERYAVLAVSSIYGIDIQEDNVQKCRQRLFEIFNVTYTRLFKNKAKSKCREAVRYILDCNIVWGDALTLKTKGDNQEPIVFAQWSLIGNKFKRMDYAFHDLTYPEPSEYCDLFSRERGVVERDTGDKGFIPEPIWTDYPPVPYWEIANAI